MLFIFGRHNNKLLHIQQPTANIRNSVALTEKKRKLKRKEILSLESIKNKKPGFITSIKTGRGITGTTAQRYKEIWKIKQLSKELFQMSVYNLI